MEHLSSDHSRQTSNLKENSAIDRLKMQMSSVPSAIFTRSDEGYFYELMDFAANQFVHKP